MIWKCENPIWNLNGLYISGMKTDHIPKNQKHKKAYPISQRKCFNMTCRSDIQYNSLSFILAKVGQLN